MRICDMRKEFNKRGWNEAVQDKIIAKLRADGVIQLLGGDPIDFTKEEIAMDFRDVYGTPYRTMRMYNHKLPTRSAAGSYKRAKKQVNR